MNKTNINLSVGFINRFWACCSSYMNIFNCTFVLSMLEHSLIAVHFNIGLQVWNIPENLPHLSHWHDFPCLQEGQVFLLPCLLGAWRLWLYFAVELPQKKHLRTCASHISVTAVIISAHCCAAPCVQQWQFYLPTFVCHSLSRVFPRLRRHFFPGSGSGTTSGPRKSWQQHAAKPLWQSRRMTINDGWI